MSNVLTPFTPPPMLGVEWECLACHHRSPYIVALPYVGEEPTGGFAPRRYGGGVDDKIGSFSRSLDGGASADGAVGSGSYGESPVSSATMLDTSGTRHSIRSAPATSALIPDDEEDSYLNAAVLEPWLWQSDQSPRRGTTSLGATQADEDAHDGEPALREYVTAAQQQERLLVEEGLLGKRQMRYCKRCGYARCAEIREVAHPTDTFSSLPFQRTRGPQNHTPLSSPPPQPHPRNATYSSTEQGDRQRVDDGGHGSEENQRQRRLPMLPEVVQHWWRRGCAKAQQWNLLPSSTQGASTLFTASPASTRRVASHAQPPTNSSGAPVEAESALTAAAVRAPLVTLQDADVTPTSAPLIDTSSSLASPMASGANALDWGAQDDQSVKATRTAASKEALWHLYTTEEAFWRLTLPDAAPPFLNVSAGVNGPVSEPSTPTTRGDPMTPPRLLSSASVGSARHAPAQNSPGRRVGYRQEVKAALSKLDNVQLNVARMRLEQAIQLLAEEEQQRRMSHN